MLSLLFSVLMICVFGKLLVAAFKLTWGVTRIAFSLVLLPIALIAMVVGGLIYIALPLLVVIGLVSLFTVPMRRW